MIKLIQTDDDTQWQAYDDTTRHTAKHRTAQILYYFMSGGQQCATVIQNNHEHAARAHTHIQNVVDQEYTRNTFTCKPNRQRSRIKFKIL